MKTHYLLEGSYLTKVNKAPQHYGINVKIILDMVLI